MTVAGQNITYSSAELMTDAMRTVQMHVLPASGCARIIYEAELVARGCAASLTCPCRPSLAQARTSLKM